MKKQITFADIDNARKTLEIGDICSIKDIKDNYKKLAFKYHPDKHHGSSDRNFYEEKIKQINNSYKIIMSYCTKYPISFNIDKVRNIEEGEYAEYHIKTFYNQWF